MRSQDFARARPPEDTMALERTAKVETCASETELRGLHQQKRKCRETSPESSSKAAKTTKMHAKTSQTHLEGSRGTNSDPTCCPILAQESASKEAIFLYSDRPSPLGTPNPKINPILSASWESLVPKPALDPELKRGRFAAPFRLQISAPRKDSERATPQVRTTHSTPANVM
jgi:hypothetical protein